MKLVKKGENRQKYVRKNISIQKCKFWITTPDQKMAFGVMQ